MKSDNENSNEIVGSEVVKDYFDFYKFILGIFAFWKTILLSVLICGISFSCIYYLIDDTYNVTLKIKQLNQSENIINDSEALRSRNLDGIQDKFNEADIPVSTNIKFIFLKLSNNFILKFLLKTSPFTMFL